MLAGEPAAALREGALAAAGPTGRVAAADVPRLLGGADALLWAVEEDLRGYGVVPRGDS